MYTRRPLLKHIIDGGRGAFYAAFPGLRPRTGAPADAESPLRAELFSSEQMVQHGKALAATHALAPGLRARARRSPGRRPASPGSMRHGNT